MLGTVDDDGDVRAEVTGSCGGGVFAAGARCEGAPRCAARCAGTRGARVVRVLHRVREMRAQRGCAIVEDGAEVRRARPREKILKFLVQNLSDSTCNNLRDAYN
jgi:hypothetical protein